MVSVQNQMAEVGVLGLGRWGTALGQHLSRKGVSTVGWDRDSSVVEGINAHGKNLKFFPDFKLSDHFSATTEIESLTKLKILVVSLPAEALAQVLKDLPLAKSTVVVSATKGLEPQSKLTPLDFFRKCLGWENPLSVLSGPSFALDVVRGKPCGVVLAANDLALANAIAEIFTSDSMKVYPSTDTVGVEWGGILKNVIAVAAGASDGLGLGDSARAALITRGMVEINRISRRLGADPRTTNGLSGLGDLLMTATSDESRNRRVGFKLGEGKSLEIALKEVGSVAEGVKTAMAIHELKNTLQVEMPIAEEVAKLIRGETTPPEMVKTLISRPVREEWD